MLRSQADCFVTSLINAEMALMHKEEESREGEYNRLRFLFKLIYLFNCVFQISPFTISRCK